jgi:pyruvate/2-oxoglutarate dehydrogenase complex dihydrolipoamide dehydrogenase (E3) component
MAAVLRAMTISETRGFMKMLIEAESDRIRGFTMFGAGAGEVMTVVQWRCLSICMRLSTSISPTTPVPL